MESSEATPPQNDLGAIASGISRGIVRLHAECYGRGPTKAKTHIANGFVLCVLEEVFTAAEQTLISHGRADQVVATRAAFKDVLEDRFREVVEEHTARRVRSFISQVDVDSDTAVELFLFENSR